MDSKNWMARNIKRNLRNERYIEGAKKLLAILFGWLPRLFRRKEDFTVYGEDRKPIKFPKTSHENKILKCPSCNASLGSRKEIRQMLGLDIFSPSASIGGGTKCPHCDAEIYITL